MCFPAAQKKEEEERKRLEEEAKAIQVFSFWRGVLFESPTFDCGLPKSESTGVQSPYQHSPLGRTR